MSDMLDFIRSEVSSIERIKGDPESAHDAEDQLHQVVLSWIASGEIPPEDAAECAAEAMKTRLIGFPRWTA